MDVMCLACITEVAEKNGGEVTEGDFKDIEWAITFAPSWQTQYMGGQMIVACVPTPTCLKHLNFSKKSPQEQSLGSGLIVPQFGTS